MTYETYQEEGSIVRKILETDNRSKFLGYCESFEAPKQSETLTDDDDGPSFSLALTKWIRRLSVHFLRDVRTLAI